MSFVGTLGDLPLADLLRVLAAGEKSGRLRLSERDGYGLVVLRQGKIVYAASDAARESLGSILVGRGLVDEPTLQQALRQQHHLKEHRPLGGILLDMGILSRESLGAVLREQIEGVLLDLLRWPSGFFRFEAETLAEAVDGVAVDVRDLQLPEGTSAEGVVLEASRRLDEERRHQPPGPSTDPSALQPLKELMAAVRAPALNAETNLLLLRYAARAVQRAVLFAPRRDGIHGLAQAGLGIADAEDRVRGLVLDWEDGSVLAEAARRRETFRGPLPPTPGNRKLLDALGGQTPSEAAVLLLEVEGQPNLLLYGDNLPDDLPMGDLSGLELLLLQTGLALEKNLLRQRLDRLANFLPAVT